MAYLDTTHLDQKPASPIVWEALMAHLDLSRVETARLPRVEPIGTAHTRQVQQMLIAATMASGAILAVAAVMLLGLL